MKRVDLSSRQTEAAECGLACIGRCAVVLGLPMDLPWLRRRFPTSTRGLSLSDLVKVAGSVGFTARALRCEPHELNELNLPCILHWKLDHFVVLEKVSRKSITIFDPTIGRISASAREIDTAFAGAVLELSWTKPFSERRERSKLGLSSTVRLTPAIRSGLAQAIILSFIVQIFSLLSPLYLQIAVDDITINGDTNLLLAVAAGFALLSLFNTGTSALRAIALQRASSLMTWDITQRVFYHMLRLPLPWFQRRRLADVLTRFQSVEPIKNLVANSLPSALIDGVMATGTAIMMFIYSPALAGISCCGLMLYGLVRAVTMPITMRLSANSITSSIAEQSKRIETLRAMQTIKLMGAEVERQADWSNKFSDSVKASQANSLAASLFAIIQGGFDGLLLVLIVYLGVRDVIAGKLSIGMLYALLAYRSQFQARATNLLEQLINWRMLEVYAFRLADVVLTPREPGIDVPVADLPPIQGKLDVENVSFRYSPTDPFVVNEMTFTVHPGERIVLTGPSGCGKSTLLKIACGLYSPIQGAVRLDGIPLSHWGPQRVREAFGVVLQDDDLIPGTIAENVTFFAQEPHADRMWECLRVTGFANDVFALPMRAESFVGDMGSSLSSGQRQRLLLARVLYKQPKILILDEATAHLDSISENQICDALEKMQVTQIIVTHRPELVKRADRVVQLRPVRSLTDRSHVPHRMDPVTSPRTISPNAPGTAF